MAGGRAKLAGLAGGAPASPSSDGGREARKAGRREARHPEEARFSGEGTALPVEPELQAARGRRHCPKDSTPGGPGAAGGAGPQAWPRRGHVPSAMTRATELRVARGPEVWPTGAARSFCKGTARRVEPALLLARGPEVRPPRRLPSARRRHAERNRRCGWRGVGAWPSRRTLLLRGNGALGGTGGPGAWGAGQPPLRAARAARRFCRRSSATRAFSASAMSCRSSGMVSASGPFRGRTRYHER